MGTVASKSGEICGRCLQPVAHADAKCRNCGMPRMRTRRLTIWIAVTGLLALLFVIVIMVKSVWDADIESAPPDGGGDNAAPSSSRGPDNPPPLNK